MIKYKAKLVKLNSTQLTLREPCNILLHLVLSQVIYPQFNYYLLTYYLPKI